MTAPTSHSLRSLQHELIQLRQQGRALGQGSLKDLQPSPSISELQNQVETTLAQLQMLTGVPRDMDAAITFLTLEIARALDRERRDDDVLGYEEISDGSSDNETSGLPSTTATETPEADAEAADSNCISGDLSKASQE